MLKCCINIPNKCLLRDSPRTKEKDPHAANYHLNFPRLVPIWPCSSVGKVTVIRSGGRGFEPHRGQILFSSSVWAHFLSGANTQKVLFGIFIQHFKIRIPHLNPKPYWLTLTFRLTCFYYIFLVVQKTERRLAEICFRLFSLADKTAYTTN